MNRPAALVVPLVLTALLISTGNGLGKTWYVAHDGSGDAPTINAAMDSSTAGDSVLVGQGEYVLTDHIRIPNDVVMISADGPLQTLIRRVPIIGPVTGIQLGQGAELDGFWVEGFVDGNVFVGWNSCVRNNIIGGPFLGMDINLPSTVRGNLFTPESFLRMVDSPATFLSNIVLCDMVISTGTYVCNNLVGDGGTDAIAAQPGLYNFSLDPEFCAGTFFLQSDSPCAPGNHPDGSTPCTLIGPLPVACGSVSVENRSWGEIKVLYGEE